MDITRGTSDVQQVRPGVGTRLEQGTGGAEDWNKELGRVDDWNKELGNRKAGTRNLRTGGLEKRRTDNLSMIAIKV